MPFGLINALVIFQSLMNDMFKVHLRKCILVFFDDILIYNNSMTNHYKHLKLVFELLKSHQLLAKKRKYVFGSHQVECLSHIIYGIEVDSDPQKIQTIMDWPTLQNLEQLRGFLGLTCYYRKFLKNNGSIYKPLTNLLKKYTFSQSNEATQAFNYLKSTMINPQVLALCNLRKLFIVKTDAFRQGIQVILMQEGYPIAYINKLLGPRQQSLREMMVILHVVTKQKHYLWGRHFKIHTDHVNLKYLMDQKVSTLQHL